MHTGCLQPPMPHPTLLAMIDASNRRLHGASVHAWRCSECANPNINVDHGQPDRQSPPLVYPVLSTIRGENQHRSIQGNQEQHKAKKAVGTRIHEWHEHVPSPRRTLRVQPITGITAAVWPPIRRKKKAEIHAQAREVENVSHDLPPKDQSRRGAVNAEHTRRRPDGRRQASKPRPISHVTSRETHGTGSPFPSSTVSAKPAVPTDISGLPYTCANHLNSPLSPTRERIHIPSTSRQTIPPPNNNGAEPFRLPFSSTPRPSLKPPLIDLSKALKRKRSMLQRSDSLTTECSNFAEGDKLLSSDSGGPPAKRQRMGERDVTEKMKVGGSKEVERPSAVMPRHSETREDNLHAKERHQKFGNEALSMVGHPHQQPEIRDDGATSQVPASRHVRSEDDDPAEHNSHAKERNKTLDNEALPMVDHTHLRSETLDNGAASQIPTSRHVRSEDDDTAEHPRVHSLRPVLKQQGTIPASSRRSSLVSSLSTTDASPLRLPILPVPPTSKVQSAPSITPLTPSSFSPPRVFNGDINDGTCVLEDIIVRLHARRPGGSTKPKLGETRIKMPRLARWFGKIQAKVQNGTRVQTRKRMVRPMMVASDEEWTFIGAPMGAAG